MSSHATWIARGVGWMICGSIVCAALPVQAALGTNGVIAFDRNDAGNDDVYVIRPDGSALTRLTTSPDSELAPAWSPDGTRIAYVRLDPGDEQYSLWVMNADGTNQHEILKGQVGRFRPHFDIIPGKLYVSEYYRPNAPAWSQDGQWILYPHARPPILIPPGEEDEGGTDESYAGELHEIHPDGTGDRTVPCTNFGPCNGNQQVGRYSPDQRFISANVDDYCPDCAGGQWVAFINRDGSSSFFAESDAADLNFSPNGTDVVFVDSNLQTLYTSHQDGSSKSALAAGTRYGLQFPSYSPDGTRIVYGDKANDASPEIYLLNADGSGLTLLTNGRRPAWQSLPRYYVMLDVPAASAPVRTTSLHVSANPAAGALRVGFRACAAATCTYAAAPIHWGTVYSAPFANNYPLSAQPDGPLTVVARAVFEDGSTADSAPVQVTLDRTPPTISLTVGTPRDSGARHVAATVADASGISKVGFRYCTNPAACTYATGTAITTSTAEPFAANFYPGPAPYAYAVVARAWDAAGNTADSAPVVVSAP